MRVFVSSTYEDLRDYRALLQASLAISRIEYNAMEHFGAAPRPPIDTCLASVDESDVFVGILGLRYGISPPRRKLSYTEREYRHARTAGKPVLMFLIDLHRAVVPAGILVAETGDQQARLRRLKAHVERNYTVTYFAAPADLARLVLASVIREFGVVM